MYNLQANGLQKALLCSNSSKIYYLGFEPLMVKKNDFKNIEVGDLLLLGEKMPKLYIYRKNVIVGQAKIGQVDGQMVAKISAKERLVNIENPKEKHILTICRLASIPKDKFIVGRLVELTSATTEYMVLFYRDKPAAVAKLVQKNNDEYMLKIIEIINE